MRRPATKRLLLCLLATAARALRPPRHRMSRALPKAAPDAAAAVAPTPAAKPKTDKKRKQTKSPQSLKVAAATLALASTAPVRSRAAETKVPSRVPRRVDGFVRGSRRWRTRENRVALVSERLEPGIVALGAAGGRLGVGAHAVRGSGLRGGGAHR